MAEGAAAAKEARAQPSSVTANGATMQQVMVAILQTPVVPLSRNTCGVKRFAHITVS